MTVAPASLEDLRRWLVQRVADRLGVPPASIDVDRPLGEYGLSSVDAVGLIGELEDRLDRSLPTTLLFDHPTITALSSAMLADDHSSAQKLPKAVGAPAEPIAVIGIGCRLPGGIHGPEQFWQELLNGVDATSELPPGRWEQFGVDSPERAELFARTTRRGGFLADIAGFDAEFFGISPREAAGMDPQQRLLLEVAWEALEHAGTAPHRLRGSSTGVFVGISGNEYGQLTLGDLRQIDAWSGTGAALSIAANRLSYAFDLRGPSLAVDTACSSSLVAVHLAIQSLRSGESDLALAAGANLLLGPGVTVNFDEMGVSSPDGRCRPFDAAANGIARAEGVGVLVLKRLADSRRDGDRVLAVLRGSAVNSDGRSNGITAPNPDAQQAVLLAACSSSGVDPLEVDYVEAHGTGTLLGDPIEARALGAVFGRGRREDDPLLLGSVKSNLGHLEAAAGIAGLIKVVLAMANGRIPASLHYAEPNPHIAFDELRLAVVDEQRPWPRRNRSVRAGVSGFGFGGTNAHVVVEQVEQVGPAAPPVESVPRHYLLTGASPERVRDSANRLAQWLADRDRDAGLGDLEADLEHSLARRGSGRSRAVITASDRAGILSGLRTLAAGQVSPQAAIGDLGDVGPGPVWVFSGQGSQWAAMGQRLLTAEPAFAEAVAELDPLILRESGLSVRASLERGELPSAFEELQPFLFGVQVALARLWHSYDVEPAAVIGHSLGEVAAAVVAGAVTLTDGVKIAVRRSRLLASTAGRGAMAVLELAPADVNDLLAEYPEVDLAAFNAPRQTVVAGPADQVDSLMSAVAARGLLASRVNSEVPGHCRLIGHVSELLRAELAELVPLEPQVPFYSTVLEDPRSTPRCDASYWAANVRRPVKFTQALAAALGDGFTSFIEVSAHPVLAQAVIQTAAEAGAPAPLVLSTLHRETDAASHFHSQRGALLAAGYRGRPTAGRLLDLPTTPWRHTRHWVKALARTAAPAGPHPLLGAQFQLPDDDRHLWQGEIGTLTQPWLSDHQIDGRPVLPAAAYVELALAAATSALGLSADEVALTNLVLRRPLALTGQTSVTTTFVPAGAGAGRVLVQSRGRSGEWLLHASTQASAVGRDVGGRHSGELDGAIAMDASDVYRRLRSLGLGHGPAFAGITELRAKAGAAMATIVLPADAPGGRFLVHPALLDSCLQVFAVLLGESSAAERTRLHLPMELGSVRRYGDAGRACQCFAKVVPVGSGALRGELRIVDQDGKVLLEITDVVVRRVRRDEVAAPLRDQLLTRVWRLGHPRAGTETIGNVLVLTDGQEPQVDWAGLGESVRVTAYTDPAAVSEALTAATVRSVLLLVPSSTSGLAGLAAAERALIGAADTVRAIVSQVSAPPPRLWLVTSGAADVLPGELIEPGPAALRGLVRVLAYEHPELRATWVDLDPVAGQGQRTADLATELAVGNDDEVAWRAGERHVARLVPATLDEPAGMPVVRADGSYLITGGLGGIGLLLAGWLVERGAKRLVLNARSMPGPAAKKMLAEIRATGATVEVVRGDIAEPGVAERVVSRAQQHGPLRGVLHAAAVFDDRTVRNLDEQIVHRTWLPKAHGAWRLHQATIDLDLDWWCGFSSVAALLGFPGQPAYATANAYVEALVIARRAAGLPGTTISWGTWADVGAVADNKLDLPWLPEFSPGEGIEMLEAVLHADRGSIGVLRFNPSPLLELFPELIQVPYFSEQFAGHAWSAPSYDDWPGAARLRTLPVVRIRSLAAAQVRTRVASILGFGTDQLDDTIPLTQLGLDSLMAVRIRNAVLHDFELALPVSLLLRQASLLSVQNWLVAELGVAGAPAVTADRRSQPAAEGPVGGSPLRVLRAGGDRTPLFFFHPGGGDTAVFRQLVELIDPAVPCYGFDRVNGIPEIEQRAERYLPELRRIQPSGPFRLIGWSFGGFLAFEVAQQLVGAGDKVEWVALIDPIIPSNPDATQLDESWFTRFAEFIERTYGKKVAMPYEELAHLQDDEERADLLMTSLLASGAIDAEGNDAILLHHRTSFLDARSIERYRPKRYPGKVLYFSATELVPDGMQDPRFDHVGPAEGWVEVCSDLDVIPVTGHHLSLLDPPNVGIIAAQLDPLIP